MLSTPVEEPLTPAYSLCGRRLLSLPDSTDPKEYGISREHLIRRLVHLLESMANRTSVRVERQSSIDNYGGKSATKTEASVGDVVLVHDTKPGSLLESVSCSLDRMDMFVVLN